jgi:2-amino-4-hydroxy-6-hydroxymethyldihydropteridine diphosphokinase
MVRVFLSLGSNVEPARCVREAVRRLRGVGRIVGISSVWRTEAIGSGPAFYNAVVEVETEVGPRELKAMLRRIEEEMGRRRDADKCAPRTIDLDILIYGEQVIEEEGLRIPDPDIQGRAFLARGIWELAPGLVLPGSGEAISQIVGRLDCREMEKLVEYTQTLRQDLGDQHD